jgi:hypothetical protein
LTLPGILFVFAPASFRQNKWFFQKEQFLYNRHTEQSILEGNDESN